MRVGIALGVDIHGSTVRRHETLLRAALHARNRQTYNGLEYRLREPRYESGSGRESLRIGMHCIRTDATNAKVWQRRKVNVLEVRSCYYFGDATAEFEHQVEELQCLADLQVLNTPGCSGAGLYSVILKQLRSANAPTWEDDDSSEIDLEKDLASILEDTLVGYCNVPEAEAYLQVWILVTDGGPDVSKARKLIKMACAERPRTLVLDSDCFAHVYHLGVLDILDALDELATTMLGVSYKGSLGALMNFLIENQSSLMSIAKTMVGPVLALDMFGSTPPKFLAGRWGAASACEEHITKGPTQTFCDVVLGFLNQPREKKDLPLAGVHAGDDILACSSYKVQRSKWTARVQDLCKGGQESRLVRLDAAFFTSQATLGAFQACSRHSTSTRT